MPHLIISLSLSLEIIFGNTWEVQEEYIVQPHYDSADRNNSADILFEQQNLFPWKEK